MQTDHHLQRTRFVRLPALRLRKQPQTFAQQLAGKCFTRSGPKKPKIIRGLFEPDGGKQKRKVSRDGKGRLQERTRARARASFFIPLSQA